MHPEANHPFQPVFRFVIGSIRGYALCFLCLVTPWLWPFLIAWILGSLWRRRQRQRVTARPVIKQATALPPPLPPVLVADHGRSLSNDEIQCFAA